MGELVESFTPELTKNSVFPNGKQPHSGSRATFKCYSKVNERLQFVYNCSDSFDVFEGSLLADGSLFRQRILEARIRHLVP